MSRKEEYYTIFDPDTNKVIQIEKGIIKTNNAITSLYNTTGKTYKYCLSAIFNQKQKNKK